MGSAKKLRNISEIRRFFHRTETPIYFVSATNFNLLGIDEWVRNFKFISYIDCYDGRHPNVFVPTEQPGFEAWIGRRNLLRLGELWIQSVQQCGAAESRHREARGAIDEVATRDLPVHVLVEQFEYFGRKRFRVARGHVHLAR